MRRWLAAVVVLGVLGGCNLFGGTTNAPTQFSGWFHLDRPYILDPLHLDRSKDTSSRIPGDVNREPG